MEIWAVWLYSVVVPKYGAKPTTMATVGVAWWTLKTLQSSQWAALGFATLGPDLLPLGMATLGATLLASVVGAWLYAKTPPARDDLATA